MIDSQSILKQFLEVTTIPGISCNERQIIDYLKHFLGRLGFGYCEDKSFQKFDGNAGNLIYKVSKSNSKGKSILLAAHVDTITISCEKPIVKNDRIISSDDRILGADDRVGVTVLLEILKLIAHNKIDYPDLEILFLVGEEVGMLGSKNLDYSNISAKQGFNFDCSAPVGQVVVQAPTALDFKIRFIGQAAHSAVAPEKGINAISMAADTLCKFNLPQKNNNIIFNIGKIQGGTKNNIIPDEAIVNGEIRSFYQKQVDQYLERINKVTQSVVDGFGGRFEIDHRLRYGSFLLDEHASVYRIAKTAIEGANKKFVPVHYLAGSDANIFNQKNIATINIGLGYVNNHSANEYILVSDLVKDVEIGAKIVQIAGKMDP